MPFVIPRRYELDVTSKQPVASHQFTLFGRLSAKRVRLALAVLVSHVELGLKERVTTVAGRITPGELVDPLAGQAFLPLWVLLSLRTPGRARDDNLHVIADLIRNPVSVWHWIPDRVRDDKTKGRVTFAESSNASPSTHTARRAGLVIPVCIRLVSLEPCNE